MLVYQRALPFPPKSPYGPTWPSSRCIPSVQVMLKPSASVAESVTKRITKLLAFHGKIMEHPREISEFSHVFLQRIMFFLRYDEMWRFQSESSSMNETVKIHQGHQDHPLSNIGDQIYDGNHNYSDNPCIIERGACFSLLRITNLQLDSKWVKHQHRTRLRYSYDLT